jgi:hypothetical protein
MRSKTVAIKPATWLSLFLVGIVIVWAGLGDRLPEPADSQSSKPSVHR